MIALLVLTPLVTAAVVGILSGQLSHKRAQFITTAGLFLSAGLAGKLFYDVAILGNAVEFHLLQWIQSGRFDVSWVLQVDSLTAVMLVVVTWVSALVHLYSVGYMSHDPHVPRFMAYLSLFTFCMLMLVTSNNFLQLFFGWEGVGLCSYLLIGFWYKKESAYKAAMKAFIVNRVGDFGFLLGIFLIFKVFGTLNFQEVFSAASLYSDQTVQLFGQHYDVLTVICLLLFVGAMGKSAQLGLHTWLPDAMEGPTPVSALIHAATMVTAGVFLVARCSPLFEYAPFALEVVTIVGAVTAIFAATVAITQNDIKRVIAYSTCSQLGYMFFACGVSAYAAGVFHLMTHGFFKALLFLGAGSVIHAMSDEQDLRKMGGVWKKIPFTYSMMWIGSLALAGVFPFAGYYSKDIILEAAYASGGLGGIAFWLGLAAAFLTAFYSWRLIILAFHGKSRASKEVLSHVHESPKVMTIPLLLLSVGAVFSGFVGAKLFGMVDGSLDFWNGAIVMLGERNILDEAHQVPALVKFSPLIVGALGISLAYVLYLWKPSIPGVLSQKLRYVYQFLLNKWYFDELYNVLFVKPSKVIGSAFYRFIDVAIIDRFGPNGAAWSSSTLGKEVNRLQTGFVYSYALVMILGVVGIIGWFMWKLI